VGHALHALWDYAGAETAFRRALEIEEKVYGADAAATAAGLSEVARLVYMRGELGAWESLLRRRLRIVEQRWGTESAEYAEALFDLASTDERKGDWPSAESAFRQVLRIRQRLLGPRHPESLDATDRLGYIAYQTSKCSEAIPLLRDSVAQRERAVGPAHPGLAASWHILGLCLERLGNLPAAAEQYENAASLVEETLGKDELSLAVYTSSLAGLLAKPDGPETRYVSRALLSRQALRIYERVLPAEHPDLAGPLTSLAASLGVQHKESESLLRRALAIEEKTPGPFQLHATRILNELAALWIYREQDASAEPLLRRALAIQEKKLSPARSLHLLAGVLARKGDYHSALPLIERALAIRERLLIAGHTDIQESRWLLMDIRGKAARPRP
jgi:tetratricopeptide (TPR) repeat protein